jgi:cell fate regulator YaaT (PSP1 superfamily)
LPLEAFFVRIVKVQFNVAGKIYDFNAGTLDLKAGEKVVVETERGRSIATVVVPPREFPANETPEGLKSILRKADQPDLAAQARNAAREKEALNFCLQKIKERNMEMKLVKVEYLFDGSKAIFYFTADGRVDFRELVKDLAHAFHTRIEMRQIGVRDEAKMVGGLGICGRELCCSSFLRDFEPVSVKMAKEQNLALNPNKISGQCGRLLCCLGYEFETYCTLRKCLPKCGKHVQCGSISGEVVKLNILEGTVTVRTDDDRLVSCEGEAIKPEHIVDRPKKAPREGGKEAGPARNREERPAAGSGGKGKRDRPRDTREKDKDKKEKR